MRSPASSGNLSTNGKPPIPLFLSELVTDASSKLLSGTIQMLAQFSAYLAAVFFQVIPELVLSLLA